MTQFTRHDLPADITVFVGEFRSQPLVFAHLLDIDPSLDLDHVEALQHNSGPRLAARFEPVTVAGILARAEGWNTIVLILPAAYAGLTCPFGETDHLIRLGHFRGRVPHLSVMP